MLEEECLLPQGSDKRFLQKLHDVHDKDGSYTKPRLASDSKFGIRHYAGDVTYGIHDFIYCFRLESGVFYFVVNLHKS